VAVEPADEWDEEAWDDEDWDDEPPRNRLAEALTVFGLTFPFALVLVAVIAAIGIGLVIAVVYAMMWLLVQALASGPDG
jgi:hypothetical protein